MAQVVKSVYIEAPVDKVFAYVANPVNRPEFWPSLVEVSEIEPLPNGGHKLNWVYKMAGVHAKGMGETIEHIPNRRTVDDNKGSVSSITAWNCEPEGSGTRLTFEGEYSVHIPLLKRLAESFLVKVNENEAEIMVANIKARMEA